MAIRLTTMEILLVVSGGDQARETKRLAEAEFEQAGAAVETLDMDETLGTTPIPTVSLLNDLAQRFHHKDLVVFATDEVRFADGGGPVLRQVSTWAETALTPVIVMAPHCRISTRELRTMGIEAGYEVTTNAEARRVVQTWVGVFTDSGRRSRSESR